MNCSGKALSVLVFAALLACGDDSDDGTCEAASKKYTSYVERRQQCAVDNDCVIVGGCSNTFGFSSVQRAAREQAQLLSVAPMGCGQSDGPTYNAVCNAGLCALGGTLSYCGAPTRPLDASTDAALDGSTDANVDSSPPDATR